MTPRYVRSLLTLRRKVQIRNVSQASCKAIVLLEISVANLITYIIDLLSEPCILARYLERAKFMKRIMPYIHIPIFLTAPFGKSEENLTRETYQLCERYRNIHICWLWFSNQYCCLLHVAACTADIVRCVVCICMRDIWMVARNPYFMWLIVTTAQVELTK
jgi:hypothetical protein